MENMEAKNLPNGRTLTTTTLEGEKSVAKLDVGAWPDCPMDLPLYLSTISHLLRGYGLLKKFKSNCFV